MRIAYGIHGYGRGHSSRALAVLPELGRRHELLILAGGDAWRALKDDYPVVRIPMLKYTLGRSGRIAPVKTILYSVPKVADLALRGPALEMVADVLAEFAPDVVISDSEPWTHGAAHNLRLPRISFDHFGVLVWCDWPMTGLDKARCRMEGLIYRRMMSAPADRTVIVSFYAPPTRREGVRVVGPVLRDLVAQTSPADGDFLMVYFSNGHIHFTPRVEAALKELDCPVVVYGVRREGAEANLDFRPPSNTRFVEDLSRCRAVFATAGNQLISEAMFFRKPMLLLPEDSLEQRLNAAAIEQMDIGMRTHRDTVTADQLRQFLSHRDRFAANIPPTPADGQARAVAAIEEYARELTGKL